jgi:predicted MFS family arabinose efflux permease
MGWRTKFVFLLIVYCAGFATAVYYLAPTPEQKSGPSMQLAQVGSALKTQELIKSFNSGMHKCIGFSKEAADEAAKLLQAKIEEAAKSQSKK